MIDLTPAQRSAVEREGQDVCVVAGPGSGKTRVLVERFAWLVIERGVEPVRILTITFTEKAAGEIKRRMVARFSADAVRREQMERASITTIDGFCARLLREHAVAAGIDPEFGILEERYGDAGLRRAANEALDSLYSRDPQGMRRLFEEWDTEEPVGSLIQAYSALRVMDCEIESLPVQVPEVTDVFGEIRSELRLGLEGARPRSVAQQRVVEEIRAWMKEADSLGDEPTRAHLRLLDELEGIRLQDPMKASLREARQTRIPLARGVILSRLHRESLRLLREALSALDQAFTGYKRRLGVLDFADLEQMTVRLLRSDSRIGGQVRGSFDAILMDELQDTNRLQAALVDLLRSPGRFFAVGDINQSIYGFRQADPDVFRDYRASVQASGGVIDELRENFRSRQEILDAVTSVFDQEKGIEPIALKSARPFPASAAPCVEVAEAANDAVEAGWVASRIIEVRRELGLRFQDMAVLVRSTSAFDAILPALAVQGIPYLVTKGRNFYSSREVRDLIALLKVIANPCDEISLLAVLRSPVVAMSEEGLMRLSEPDCLSAGLSRDLGAPAGTDEERLARFQGLLAGVRAQRDEIAPDRLLARVVDTVNYVDGLDWRARANVDKFLSVMREIYATRPRPLAETVDEIELLRLADSEPDAPPAGQREAVVVMTVHAAKGLEFPVVFVPAMQRGVDRTKPELLVSAEGVGARWREGGGDALYRRVQARIEERENEEANRLLYVALTRAEQRLILSFSSSARLSNWAKRTLFLGVAPVHVEEAEAPAYAAAVTGEEVPFVVERPRATGQYPSWAAVTEVAAFHARPDEGICEAVGAGGAALGTAVHRLLAGLPVREPDAEAVQLADAFRSSALGLRIARAQRVDRETDVVFAVEDIVLHGQIDVWFEEGGQAVVLDYKTDAVERFDTHAIQVRLYVIGLKGLLGRKVDSALVCYLRLGKTVEVGLNKEELEEARDAVRRWGEAYSSSGHGAA